MRKITKIVVHCAYTFHDMNVDADWIHDIHVNQNGWKSIGYHHVIKRNGDVEDGRTHEQSGAHVRGHNHDSIGVCLIGGKGKAGRDSHSHASNFTHAQYESLRNLILILLSEYPEADIYGHCDLDSSKTCPSFDVKSFVEGLI